MEDVVAYTVMNVISSDCSVMHSECFPLGMHCGHSGYFALFTSSIPEKIRFDVLCISAAKRFISSAGLGLIESDAGRAISNTVSGARTF